MLTTPGCIGNYAPCDSVAFHGRGISGFIFEHLLVQPTCSNGKIRFLRNNDPDTYQAQYIKNSRFCRTYQDCRTCKNGFFTSYNSVAQFVGLGTYLCCRNENIWFLRNNPNWLALNPVARETTLFTFHSSLFTQKNSLFIFICPHFFVFLQKEVSSQSTENYKLKTDNW